MKPDPNHEHSADIIDQANDAAEVFLDAALETARNRSEPEEHPDFDGEHCVEPGCGEELPRERLALGRIRCVDCQQRRELEALQYWGR